MKTCVVLSAEPWMRIRAYCLEVALFTKTPEDFAASLSVFPVHLDYPVLNGHRHEEIASRRNVVQSVTVQPFFGAGSSEENRRATASPGSLRTDVVIAFCGAIDIHVIE